MSKKHKQTFMEGENVYALAVIGRGEDLFFKENERGLICNINIITHEIFKNSVDIWAIQCHCAMPRSKVLRLSTCLRDL